MPRPSPFPARRSRGPRVALAFLLASAFAAWSAPPDSVRAEAAPPASLDLPDSPIETIWVVPHSHTDVGFTATPREVAALMEEAGRNALALAEKDPDYRWTFESFWQLERLLGAGPSGESSDPAVEAAVLAHLRSGRFGLSAAYATPHASLMSAWALDRNFAIPTEWAAARGLTLDWAILNDVPGHPIDLPKFLAARGVKYLAVGANQSLAPRLPDAPTDRPLRWRAPDGSSVLLWISSEAYVDAYMKWGIDPGTARFFNRDDFGLKDDFAIMRKGIARMLRWHADRGYEHDAVLALHGFDNWGSGASERLPAAMRMWNERVERPKIRIGNPGDFFRHVEAKYGDRLGTVTGDWGGQWEPVKTQIPTALARTRARELELARMPDPPLDEVRRSLLVWEHSFGMGPPWPGLLTRETAVRHNREQFEFVESWPVPPPEPMQGVELDPARAFPEARAGWLGRRVPGTRSDELRLMSAWFGPFGGDMKGPIPDEARVGRSVRWIEAAGADRDARGPRLVLHHAIDRRALGPDEAHVVWTWRLEGSETDGEIAIRTAAGERVRGRDEMGGYLLDWWIAPDEFRVGGTTFRPRGPFVFAVKGDPPMLLGKVVDQNLVAEFKEGEEGRLAFEEAYPGEDPVLRFSIEVTGEGAERARKRAGNPRN